MESSSNSLPTGTMLENKYRIEELIGSGGMGMVYRATHVVINRAVAIKVLHSEHAQKKQAVERFLQEARAAGSIGDDHICEVTDFGQSPEAGPFLVLPLLKGKSLSAVMRQGELDLLRLLSITVQTLGALEAAHDANIVHRDLKPDNIFLTSVGEHTDFVKLLDFGISKMTDDSGPVHKTHTGVILGTPSYMAPEQIRGARPLDGRVDLFAMGVILYEATSSRRPFGGENANEMMFNIVSESFPPPRLLNEQIAPPLQRIILKGMARSRSQRYRSASEMGQEIRAFMESNPTNFALPRALGQAVTSRTRDSDAPPQTTTRNIRSRLRDGHALGGSPPKRFLIWGGIVAACALVLGILWYLMSVDQPGALPAKPAPPKPSVDAAQVAQTAEETPEVSTPEEDTQPAPTPKTKKARAIKKRSPKRKTQSKKAVKPKGRFGTELLTDYEY